MGSVQLLPARGQQPDLFKGATGHLGHLLSKGVQGDPQRLLLCVEAPTHGSAQGDMGAGGQAGCIWVGGMLLGAAHGCRATGLCVCMHVYMYVYACVYVCM